MLDVYTASRYVEEVIIIDNNPAARPELTHPKLRILTRGENLYVNPAWNWGAAEARHELVLANDDIEFGRFDELVEAVAMTDFDIVGACNCAEDREILIDEIESLPLVSPYNPAWSCGYGSLMFIRRYTQIPKTMKIYFGDNILFDRSTSKGMFHGLKFVNPSSTAERTDEWDDIKKNDERAYIQYLDERGTGLSVAVIARDEAATLKSCLESVRSADEIIVVDTGSTDNTVEIASGLTDKVFRGEDYRWREDFSYSR